MDDVFNNYEGQLDEFLQEFNLPDHFKDYYRRIIVDLGVDPRDEENLVEIYNEIIGESFAQGATYLEEYTQSIENLRTAYERNIELIESMDGMGLANICINDLIKIIEFELGVRFLKSFSSDLIARRESINMVHSDEDRQVFEENFGVYHIDRLNSAFDIFNSEEFQNSISDSDLRNVYLEYANDEDNQDHYADLTLLKIRILRNYHSCCSRFLKITNTTVGGNKKKRRRKQSKKINKKRIKKSKKCDCSKGLFF